MKPGQDAAKPVPKPQTLFGLTLIMNIVALAIVRKYREQYE